MPASTCSRPTTSFVRRSSTSTIVPCALPRNRGPSMRTVTRSPCRTSRIWCAGRYTCAEPSSGSSQPSPLRCAWTVPTVSPASCSRRQYWPRRFSMTSPRLSNSPNWCSACAAPAGPKAAVTSSSRRGRSALRSTFSTASSGDLDARDGVRLLRLSASLWGLADPRLVRSLRMVPYVDSPGDRQYIAPPSKPAPGAEPRPMPRWRNW